MTNDREITMTLGGQSVVLRVQQMPARRSVTFLHSIARYVAPAFASIKQGPRGLTVGSPGAAIDAVLRNVSEEELNSFMDRLMEFVSVKGKPLAGMFDILFKGEIANVFKLFRFVLEVNYENFFKDLTQAVMSFLPAEHPLRSPNQSDTSGESGDSSQTVGQA
jgi:hypothetical protein